jgi:hypothetical protein
MSDASIEKFRAYHERGSRVKFYCLRLPHQAGGEFGILPGFTANNPKFFLLAIFAQLFLKKLRKKFIAQNSNKLSGHLIYRLSQNLKIL